VVDADSLTKLEGLWEYQQAKAASALKTGDWSAVTQVLHRASLSKHRAGRVLLVGSEYSHSEDADPPFRPLGTFYLNHPSDFKYNDLSRAMLKQTPRTGWPRFEFTSHAERNKYAIAAILLQLDHTRAYDMPIFKETFSHLGTSFSHPTYKNPRVPLDPFFSRHALKTNSHASYLKDFETTVRLTSPDKVPAVQRLLVESAIPGAYPPSDVSNAYADFAIELHKWLKGTVPAKPRALQGLPSPAFGDSAYKTFTHFYSGLYSTRLQYDHEIPTTCLKPSTHYGFLEAATIPAGFTSSEALSYVVGELAPSAFPGRYGQWLTLASKAPLLARSSVWLESVAFFSSHSNPTMHKSSSFTISYLEGKLSFYPPANFGLSSTIVALNRTLALSFIEAHPSLFFLDELIIYDIVYRLEILCVLAHVKSLISICKFYPVLSD
jgi:hypothetical protein